VLEKKQDEGSKTRSNGDRIGNALPLMVEGSKARSKRNKTRAGRHARNGDKTRARRRARIENERWWENTDIFQVA
jgi:hypothetical protein